MTCGDGQPRRYYRFCTPQENGWLHEQLVSAEPRAAYTQAGALSRIEYGLRDGAVYGVTPAAQVSFTTATDRTDVPAGTSQDLACASGATCNVVSPTFWGKYRLTTITTQARQGSSLQTVDSWALTQTLDASADGGHLRALACERADRLDSAGRAR